MKQIVLLIFAAAIAHAQPYSTSPPTSYPALDAYLSSKPGTQTGSGAPSGSCTYGRDFYTDTAPSPGRMYYCDATNHWTVVPLQVPLYYQNVKVGGFNATQRPVLNFLSGTNVTITCVDNSGTGATDCEWNATAGAGGYSAMQANGTPLTARTTANFSALFGLSDNAGAGRTDITLANSGVTPATYGSASVVPVITFDAFGRATNGSTATITPAAIGAAPAPTALTLSFSASPTFDLGVTGNVSRIEMPLTASISSSTFAHLSAGRKFSVALTQNNTGGWTVVWPVASVNTCSLNTAPNITTTQFFEVASDGVTVSGVGCTTDDTLVTIAGPTGTACATNPPSGQLCAWFDATASNYKVKNSAGAVFVTVAPLDCTGTGHILKINTDGTVTCSADSGAGSPLTTKGDLFGHSTVDARLGVGADGQFLSADSTQTLGVKWAAAPGSGTVASGTATMTSGSPIAAGACVTVTRPATGVLTSDVVDFTPNASIKAVTGYAPLATGGLQINAYPGVDTANFDQCNPTTSSITPSAIVLNWRVAR